MEVEATPEMCPKVEVVEAIWDPKVEAIVEVIWAAEIRSTTVIRWKYV